MLTKDAILSAKDFTTTEVEVPEWGGTVTVRGLSSKERDRMEAEVAQTQDLQNFRARLVVMGIVDENGDRIFADKDANALGQKSSVVVDRLFDAVRKLSGMDDEALGVAEGN
jgi:hypothetical protein